MQLVTTIQRLNKLFRKGIKDVASWDRRGPCPEFLEAAAVRFNCNDKDFIIFINFEKFKELKKDEKIRTESSKRSLPLSK